MMSWPTVTTDVGSPGEAEHTVRGSIQASLVCVSGPDMGTRFRISKHAVVIGRTQADINVRDNEVSRRHARVVYLGPNTLEVEDLRSSNGTLVNGRAVKRPTPVNVGDRIQIGRSVLVFAQHDELAEQVSRLQKLESMATLAGSIAHDFNNSLSVILLNLDLVGDTLADPDARLNLDEAKAAATAAVMLAKRMLHLARPESAPFVAVEISELAGQTAVMARRRATAPIEIVVNVDPGLRAFGAADELHQVLLNLCINAVDAMPDGGRLAISGRRVVLDREQAIEWQLGGAGDYVEISVTDNGCGMDDATLARAFEPFFTTKPRNQGTGLGLAMIHSTIRRHNGTVDVKSVVGHGTTFRLVLPMFVPPM